MTNVSIASLTWSRTDDGVLVAEVLESLSGFRATVERRTVGGLTRWYVTVQTDTSGPPRGPASFWSLTDAQSWCENVWRLIEVAAIEREEQR